VVVVLPPAAPRQEHLAEDRADGETDEHDATVIRPGSIRSCRHRSHRSHRRDRLDR
jgi:hypothetical protein